MEHVLGHVDVEEMYLDVDPENLPDKGEIVETAHFFVGQAYNAHIHVVEKESGDMVMHINCTIMYSKERLQAFADLNCFHSGGLFVQRFLQALCGSTVFADTAFQIFKGVNAIPPKIIESLVHLL